MGRPSRVTPNTRTTSAADAKQSRTCNRPSGPKGTGSAENGQRADGNERGRCPGEPARPAQHCIRAPHGGSHEHALAGEVEEDDCGLGDQPSGSRYRLIAHRRANVYVATSIAPTTASMADTSSPNARIRTSSRVLRSSAAPQAGCWQMAA